MTENTMISKVWNFVNMLKDDAVGYGIPGFKPQDIIKP